MKLASASDFRVIHEDWGKETRTLIVRASDSDQREWVAESPLVGQLASKNIANVGITWAKRFFEMQRRDPSGPFFLACFDGGGEVLINGSPITVAENSACLLPSSRTNELQMGESTQWTYVFVRYQEPLEGLSRSPRFAEYDAIPLVEAVRGLYAEANGAASTAALQLWVELIHRYVLQFIRPSKMDPRLTQAWDVVVSRLGDHWTLDQIAAEASMSSEHFRRLCLDMVGCSPMKHLGRLRMQYASELLTTTDLTIDAISSQIGYEFASTFSNRFQKWSGQRPSEFRTSSAHE